MGYSPGLAIGTAVFELAAAYWTLRGKGERSILRTTGAILILLATYQIIEVAVCSNTGAAGFLPRLAFIAVTWLPPLGLVLISQLYRPKSRLFQGQAAFMLAAAAGIMVWIALDPGFARISVCSAVYARYIHAMPRFTIYASFYWLGLLCMILFSGYGMWTSKEEQRKRLLTQVFWGSLAFIVPSVIVSYYVPGAQGAMPSIMCHFALLLAGFLVWMVYLMRHPSEQEDRPPLAASN